MFEQFSDTAKIWIYQSDRSLSETEQLAIQHQLEEFVVQWTAHGAKLQAEAKVISDYHIALVVENSVQASGCSIDSSVRFIKDVGSKYNINFLNRLQMLIEKKKTKNILHFAELSMHPEAFVFDNRVSTLGEWRKNWKQPVKSYLAGI